MLTTVTLTGADHSVDPSELRNLSKEFPFVEWGVLFGSVGGPRFPSIKWIHELVMYRETLENRINLSLHICGRPLREIAKGKSDLFGPLGPQLCAFSRCQLNWHGEPQDANVPANILQAFCSLSPWDPEIIFQLDGVNDYLMRAVERRFRVSGLFDVSHGAGVLPESWPKPRAEFACGWAGGLGPNNVQAESEKIAAVAFKTRPYWIDMETLIRSDDGSKFDLDKCRSVLEQMKPFITQ